MKIDELEQINLFRAGWRYGRDTGFHSAREAENELRRIGKPYDAQSVDIFLNGADDGAKNDTFRYLLSFFS